MNKSVNFSFEEINALNKLLGQVKKEEYLSADELHFYTLSPYIISALEKVHKEYMDCFREKIKEGEYNTEIDSFRPENDFCMTEKSSIKDIERRLLALNLSNKEYIKTLDDNGREQYCMSLFAPFKPTTKQKQAIIELLKTLV